MAGFGALSSPYLQLILTIILSMFLCFHMAYHLYIAKFFPEMKKNEYSNL